MTPTAPTTASPDPPPGLVFVDLDRCLLVDDSLSAFLAHLIQRGLVPKRSALRGVFAYLGYRLNLVDPDWLIRQGARRMAGFAEQPLIDEAADFFAAVIRYRYRHSMLRELERHREAGRSIFLLTGGLPYLPRLIAQDLELDGTCATHAEVREGVFTGRILDPPCVGDGKIVHAHRAAQNVDATFEGLWFYSDSYSDLPMFLLASHPIAVNADRKLLKLAKKRGWRRMD